MRKQRILRVLAISLVTLVAGVLGSGSAQASVTVVVALGAGGGHTCAITTDGGLQCWGYNEDGQLGDGTLDNRAVPAAVEGLDSGVTAVDGSWFHTCALTVTGGVKCWGSSWYLGDGTWDGGPAPVDVVGLETGVSMIATKLIHTCAVTLAGDVKCWGDNGAGQLGNGERWNHSTVPVDVVGLDGGAVAVAAGRGHTCALTAAGAVKCWGSNYAGQLGDGTLAQSNVPVDVLDEEGSPLSGVAIAAGIYHTCLLTATGGVQCWGLNDSGQLGDGTSGEDNFSSTPVDVQGLEGGVEAIAPGGVHTCALTTSGGVKCWGSDGYGQLGTATIERCPSLFHNVGTDPCSTTAVDVTGVTDGVEAVAAGDAHTCAVTTSGRVTCWGNNSVGQLGNGTLTDSPVPVAVLFDADKDGCADELELGANPALGGRRDPKSFWDFFDVPVAGSPRDRVVNAFDIGAVVLRFGAFGDPAIDPLSPPPASGYHTAFDRSPPAEGHDPWDLGPPDGSIDSFDIAAVVIQFGHTCA